MSIRINPTPNPKRAAWKVAQDKAKDVKENPSQYNSVAKLREVVNVSIDERLTFIENLILRSPTLREELKKL